MKVKEKSTARDSIRKEIGALLRSRIHIVDKVADASKELEDINQGLYDAYEKLNIKRYKLRGKVYAVGQNKYHNWKIDKLRKFLRNKYGLKITNTIIEKETIIKESINDEELQKLINSVKGKKTKEKLRDTLGTLVDVTESKKFIRISSK